MMKNLPSEIEAHYYSQKRQIVHVLDISTILTQRYRFFLADGKADIWEKTHKQWKITQPDEETDALTDENIDQGVIIKFKYKNFKEDPTPKVLVIGRFVSPNTGTCLVCGINLNYLSIIQEQRLLDELPRMLQFSDTRDRYSYVVDNWHDIFQVAYRTYDEGYIFEMKIVKL